MKCSTVYLRAGALYVHASSETVDGVWILEGPCSEVRVDAPARAKGLAIRTALDNSRTGISHPTSWANLFGPVLDRAKAKSWAAFVKGTRAVHVSEDGPTLKLTPTENLGPAEGFVPIEHATVELAASATAEEVGAAIDELFNAT